MYFILALSIGLLAGFAYLGSVIIAKKPRNPGDEYEIIEDES